MLIHRFTCSTQARLSVQETTTTRQDNVCTTLSARVVSAFFRFIFIFRSSFLLSLYNLYEGSYDVEYYIPALPIRPYRFQAFFMLISKRTSSRRGQQSTSEIPSHHITVCTENYTMGRRCRRSAWPWADRRGRAKIFKSETMPKQLQRFGFPAYRVSYFIGFPLRPTTVTTIEERLEISCFSRKKEVTRTHKSARHQTTRKQLQFHKTHHVAPSPPCTSTPLEPHDARPKPPGLAVGRKADLRALRTTTTRDQSHNTRSRAIVSQYLGVSLAFLSHKQSPQSTD